ncbi:hypothetical protein SAMN05428974_1945 [Sphingopyxis sp. YR583]|jgi:hypothetical protein|uniref:hypothetical protein n=1 Tax=Sphingopyxis sp. YR583 TaxID=1881047 RepID=UPI0008A749EB|nr:hypothetical protein [Sphingopyxis sp. YR583]SEH16822.1 hypothetical protein SAMN05428974_1945 [Sphingopyxis sp. YR583]
MAVLKKAAISLAAISMVLSPVAASAASSAVRAASAAEGQNDLEGGSWVAIVLGLAIVAGGIWLVVDDNDDEPVSP